MGQKNKQSRKRKYQAEDKKGGKKWIITGIVVVAAVTGILMSGKLSSQNNHEHTGRSFTHGERETGTVLDPMQFTGQVRAAYAAAQKYPDVLNEVFCYCYCDAEPFNHRSLLSCFTDRHGAG